MKKRKVVGKLMPQQQAISSHIRIVIPSPGESGTGRELSWDQFRREAKKLADKLGAKLAGRKEYEDCLKNPKLLGKVRANIRVVFLGTYSPDGENVYHITKLHDTRLRRGKYVGSDSLVEFGFYSFYHVAVVG